MVKFNYPLCRWGLLLAMVFSVVTVSAAEGPRLSGFVDVGYNYNFNGLSTNTYRAFDGQANSFTLQNAEVILAGENGDVAYRVDVGFGKDPGVVSSFDRSEATGGQINLQQAFLSFPCPLTHGTVTVGKFVTPFGAEVIESKDNDNTSRGLLFTNAIPLVHTGVRYDKGLFEGKWTLTGGVVNGWDVSDDTNKGKSLFVQTAVAPLSQISVLVGGMMGPESASPSALTATSVSSTEKQGRTLVDLVVKFLPTEKLVLVANADYGVEEGAAFESTSSGDTTANWSGVALYGNYAFTRAYSARLRLEYLDDEGSRLTAGARHQFIKSTTLTLQKKRESLIGRLEYRRDFSSDPVYTKKNGARTDVEQTLGVNLIYMF